VVDFESADDLSFPHQGGIGFSNVDLEQFTLEAFVPPSDDCRMGNPPGYLLPKIIFPVEGADFSSSRGKDDLPRGGEDPQPLYPEIAPDFFGLSGELFQQMSPGNGAVLRNE